MNLAIVKKTIETTKNDNKTKSKIITKATNISKSLNKKITIKNNDISDKSTFTENNIIPIVTTKATNNNVNKCCNKKNKNYKNKTSINYKSSNTIDLTNYHENLSKSQKLLLHWHHRLCHLNMRSIQNMARKGILPK